jgi:dGTPase
VALQDILKISIKKIYNNRSVIQIENAGYNVMYELLSHFVQPTLKADRLKADKMALKLLPIQFTYDGTPYERVMGIIDFISGMTDNYATDLYRKIKGIDIGMSF